MDLQQFHDDGGDVVFGLHVDLLHPKEDDDTFLVFFPCYVPVQYWFSVNGDHYVHGT